MSAEKRPSEVIRKAIAVVHQQVSVTKRNMYTPTIREVSALPLADWLKHEAEMYALYDDRDWSEADIDRRVTKSSRAALAFARSITETI